jgi:hypothetical protein
MKDNSEFLLTAYGVGEEMLNADAPTPLLSDIISNALPQSMMKDGKMNNDINVSLSFADYPMTYYLNVYFF